MKKFIFLGLIIGLTACTKSPTDSSPGELNPDQIFLLSSQEASLDFGEVIYKSSKLKTLQINNDSEDSVGPLTFNITGDNEDQFKIVYNNCQNLLPHKSCIVKVSFTNYMLQQLSFTAQLVVNDLLIDLSAQGPSVTSGLVFLAAGQAANNLNLGTINQGVITKGVYFRNLGPLTEELGMVMVDSPNFVVTFDACSQRSLGPGKTCRLMISFSSEQKLDQVYSANLTLQAEVSGGVVSNPNPEVKVLERGTEVESIDFGNTINSQLKTLVIKNTGNTIINNPAPVLDPDSFGIPYSSCNNPLLPNKACSVKLYFDAQKSSAGIHQASLSISQWSIPVQAQKRPKVISASLTGPGNRWFGQYYTSKALGVEIVPQVQTEFDNSVILKYSHQADCQNSQELSNFDLNPDSPNELYVVAVDSNGISSDCAFVGELVSDNTPPEINFDDDTLVNVNAVGSSTTYQVNYNLVDDNLIVLHQEEVLGEENCQSTSSGSDSSSSSKTISLNIREFKKLLVKAQDRAGNETVKCSPLVTFGQVDHVAFNQVNPVNLLAQKNQQVLISLQDIYNNNNLSDLNLTATVAGQSQVLNTGSGQVAVELSSSPLYSGSGFKLLDSNNQVNYSLDVAYSPTNKMGSQALRVLRQSCAEILYFDNISDNGTYQVAVDGNGLKNVFCDMVNGGWMRLDNALNYNLGKNCEENSGVTETGEWDSLAIPQSDRVNTSKGACGISLVDNILMEQIKVEDSSLSTNNTCSSINYPEPQIQVVKANDVKDYSSVADELSGYDFQASTGSVTTVFSKNLSGGLTNGIYSFNEGLYKLHFASKAEEKMGVQTVTHNNGNVTNKNMFTLADDIIANESSITYHMVTGWISHSSTMSLRNTSGTAVWSASKTRNNGSFSTVDDFPVSLTNAFKNYYFTLTSTASVWNNSNGNHASDSLYIDLKYNTCIQKPVSVKLWAKTGAYIYPKNCQQAQDRDPSLVGSGTAVLITIDPDGYNGPVSPSQVLCDFNTAGGGWTNIAANVGDFTNVFTAQAQTNSAGTLSTINVTNLGVNTSSQSSAPLTGSLISIPSDSGGGSCNGYIQYLQFTPSFLQMFNPQEVRIKGKSYGTGSHACGGMLRYSNLVNALVPLVRLSPTNFDIKTLGRCDGNGSYPSTSNSSVLDFYSKFSSSDFTTAKSIGALEAQCGSGTSYVQFSQVWVR